MQLPTQPSQKSSLFQEFIVPAGHLQGKGAIETGALIKEALKEPEAQVAAIGLAGENRVYMSTIEHANSSASRGVGMIMGDKRLKAIAVRGTKDIDMCKSVPPLSEPMCVQVCRGDALTYEEREEEETRDEWKIGLEALANEHGLEKRMEAVARMSKKG